MSRRKRGRPIHGIVLLDKPAGPSSNQVLQKVRHAFQARKAGHTGSLDPFATGMLPVCLGEACKTAAFMLAADKSYRAVARLGEATSTGDKEGEVVTRAPVPNLRPMDIEPVLAGLVGEMDQVPPMYSALKHQGKPLYQWARQGVEIERKARRVTIYSLEFLAWNAPDLEFEVRCSKGTYIRTLAEDIAQQLGTVAHLTALRRLAVQPFGEGPMVSLEELLECAQQGAAQQFLLPVDAGLENWPEVQIDAENARAFSNGNAVEGTHVCSGWVRVRGPQGRLMGLAECTDEGLLRPRRVMNMDDQEPPSENSSN